MKRFLAIAVLLFAALGLTGVPARAALPPVDSGCNGMTISFSAPDVVAIATTDTVGRVVTRTWTSWTGTALLDNLTWNVTTTIEAFSPGSASPTNVQDNDFDAGQSARTVPALSAAALGFDFDAATPPLAQIVSIEFDYTCSLAIER